MKKRLIALLICIGSAALSGCGAIQVNERLFVQMMGIRENDGIYELSVQVCPTENVKEGESKPDYKVMTGRGRSIYEAASSIMRESGRQLFFGHCRLIFADGNILRDGEKLKTLAGERISIGCPVVYSDDPARSVGMKDGEGNIIGADKAESVLDQYCDDGFLTEATLKSVCEAAENGRVMVLPRYDESPSGSAVLNGETTAFMNLTESAAYNLINGSDMTVLTVLGGRVTVESPETSVYFQSLDSGGEYQLTVTADCTVSELGETPVLAEYADTAAEMIGQSAENILNRAYHEGFIDIFTDLEDIPYYSDRIYFSVDAHLSVR